MSFIHDALKKSEAERRQGEVPRLQNEPFTPPPRRRPVWPLVLALALLLNGAVLGWWLLAGKEAPAPAEVAAGAKPQQEETGGEVSRKPAVTTAESAAPESQPPTAESQPAATAPPRVAALPAEPEVVTEVIEEPAVPPAAPAARLVPAEIVETDPPIRPQQPPATAAAKPKVAAGAPAVDSFPPIAELPGNVRASLPRLDLQLHFFTPDPERRLIRLNGVNLRQGGSSGDGLSVVEITSDGVKLVYGGNRFFLPTGRL